MKLSNDVYQLFKKLFLLDKKQNNNIINMIKNLISISR